MIAIPRMWWPLTIGASNNSFQVAEQANSYTVKTLTSGVYNDPEALAADLVARINEVLGAPDITYSISNTTGRLTLARASANWKISFNVPNPCGAEVGFGIEERQNALAYTATLQMRNGWWPAQAIEDERPLQVERLGGYSTSLSGVVKAVEWGKEERRALQFSWLPASKTLIEKETASTAYEALQRLYNDGWARFRYWRDGTVVATYMDLVLDKDGWKKFPPKRVRRRDLYSVVLLTRTFVG